MNFLVIPEFSVIVETSKFAKTRSGARQKFYATHRNLRVGVRKYDAESERRGSPRVSPQVAAVFTKLAKHDATPSSGSGVSYGVGNIHRRYHNMIIKARQARRDSVFDPEWKAKWRKVHANAMADAKIARKASPKLP